MSSELLTITGTVTFRERLALPPGAIASVKIVDTDGDVLAAAAVTADGVPTAFSLTIDAGLVPDTSKLFAWAALRSEAGVWGTTDLVRIKGDEPEIVLTKIEN